MPTELSSQSKLLRRVFTAFAEYFLMEPSNEYSPFMSVVREKTFMSNLVISFLIENESAAYEDLLNKLEVIYSHSIILSLLVSGKPGYVTLLEIMFILYRQQCEWYSNQIYIHCRVSDRINGECAPISCTFCLRLGPLPN